MCDSDQCANGLQGTFVATYVAPNDALLDKAESDDTTCGGGETAYQFLKQPAPSTTPTNVKITNDTTIASPSQYTTLGQIGYGYLTPCVEDGAVYSPLKIPLEAGTRVYVPNIENMPFADSVDLKKPVYATVIQVLPPNVDLKFYLNGNHVTASLSYLQNDWLHSKVTMKTGQNFFNTNPYNMKYIFNVLFGTQYDGSVASLMYASNIRFIPNRMSSSATSDTYKALRIYTVQTLPQWSVILKFDDPKLEQRYSTQQSQQDALIPVGLVQIIPSTATSIDKCAAFCLDARPSTRQFMLGKCNNVDTTNPETSLESGLFSTCSCLCVPPDEGSIECEKPITQPQTYAINTYTIDAHAAQQQQLLNRKTCSINSGATNQYADGGASTCGAPTTESTASSTSCQCLSACEKMNGTTAYDKQMCEDTSLLKQLLNELPTTVSLGAAITKPLCSEVAGNKRCPAEKAPPPASEMEQQCKSLVPQPYVQRTSTVPTCR